MYKTQDEAIKETTARYVTAHNDFAVEHGLNEAILFDKLVRLHEHLKGATDDDGRQWIRMELSDWVQELPFWSEMTIRRVIKSCEQKELINSRTFTGRCKWYSVNKKYRHNVSVQNEQIQVFNMNSPSVQSEQLPNSLPNSLPKEEAPPQNNQKQLQHKELAIKAAQLLGIDHLPIKAQVSTLNGLTQWLVSVEATPTDIDTFYTWWWTWAKTPPGVKQVKRRWAEALAQKTPAAKPTKKKLTRQEAQEKYDLEFAL